MVTIENQYLKATINQKGAELASLIKKADQMEYMWQADPAHWSRHAPVLFPIVGKLKSDEYLLDDKRYSLSQHGYAMRASMLLFNRNIALLAD
jgi:galactose mutarotase-like enzyme